MNDARESDHEKKSIRKVLFQPQTSRRRFEECLTEISVISNVYYVLDYVDLCGFVKYFGSKSSKSIFCILAKHLSLFRRGSTSTAQGS